MIDRENLSNYITEYIDIDIDILFDVIENNIDISGIIFHYYDEIVVIYDTINDLYVSWYKLTHIGRALETNILGTVELKFFMMHIKNAIDEYKKLAKDELF